VLDDWGLIDDLDEVHDILILRFGDVIIDFEKFLYILELGIILNKVFEYSLILLIADFDEILTCQNRCYLAVKLAIKDFIDNSTNARCQTWIRMIKPESIIHYIR
jgi:hypothetical protein